MHGGMSATYSWSVTLLSVDPGLVIGNEWAEEEKSEYNVLEMEDTTIRPASTHTHTALRAHIHVWGRISCELRRKRSMDLPGSPRFTTG